MRLGTAPSLWEGRETRHAPALRFLAPHPRAELAPADAERLGVVPGDEVVVSVNGTSVRAAAALRGGVQPGIVFLVGAEPACGAGAWRCRKALIGARRVDLVLIVKAIVIFAVVLGIVPLILLLERKLLAVFRPATGRTGSARKGLIQPLADVLKLLSKEHSTPGDGGALDDGHRAGDLDLRRGRHARGDPVRAGLTPGAASSASTAIDVSIGLLYFFAFGSLAFYGLCWAAGRPARSTRSWARCAPPRSSSPTRWHSASSLLGVAMTAGSLSLVDIVESQDDSLVHRAPARRLPDLPGRRLRRDLARRRSTSPRPTRRSWPATTPSTAGCASARSSWPSTSR